MKKILTKIQSVSDIITNSSSEVFLISSDCIDTYLNVDDCISIKEIRSLDDLDNYSIELYQRAFPELPNFIFHRGDDFNYEFNKYKKENEAILTKLIGYFEVDIEDHFDDWEEYTDCAKDDCIASLYCH